MLSGSDRDSSALPTCPGELVQRYFPTHDSRSTVRLMVDSASAEMRPVVVTREQLSSPPAEQSAGMQRGEAFAHDGVWAGFSAAPGNATTGWHHHGDYATYAYITDGRMTVEYGAVGDAVDVEAGGFAYIPAHLVHRESVAPEGGSGVIVRVGGSGPTVINVDGPDSSG